MSCWSEAARAPEPKGKLAISSGGMVARRENGHAYSPETLYEGRGAGWGHGGSLLARGSLPAIMPDVRLAGEPYFPVSSVTMNAIFNRQRR